MMRVFLLAIAICFSPLAFAGETFQQSLELNSPASNGFIRGITLHNPKSFEDWPGDLFPSKAENPLGRTEKQIQYLRETAYPTYRAWVRVGNALTGLILSIFLAGFMFFWR